MNNWFLIILNNLLLLFVLTAGLSIGIDDEVQLDDGDVTTDDLRLYALETPAAVKLIEPNYHGDTVNVDGRTVIAQPETSVAENSSGELKRARRSKQNLCEHLCTCDLEAKFVTVNCSFLMDKVSFFMD